MPAVRPRHWSSWAPSRPIAWSWSRENRYEWIVVDIAIQIARATDVAVHSTLTGPQIAYQINDSGAKIVIVSGTEQAQKLAAVAGTLPGRHPIPVDRSDRREDRRPCHSPVVGSRRPRSTEADGKALEERALETTKPDDLATILYTSGTTGEPKGVMLTNRNLTSNCHAVMEAFSVEPDDLRLSWLPLSHSFARTSDYYLWIASGGQLALAQSRDTIIADCQALHPTHLNGVPYFFDKVYRSLQDKGVADKPGVLQGSVRRTHEAVLRRRSGAARSAWPTTSTSTASLWCKATG